MFVCIYWVHYHIEFKFIYIYIYIYIFYTFTLRNFVVRIYSLQSTRSPFVTLLSRRAQSGRWSSFGKRVWFTESHIDLIISFLLLVLFTKFILHIKQWRAISSKTTRSFLGNWHSHFSVLPLTPHPYATDFLTELLASVISC